MRQQPLGNRWPRIPPRLTLFAWLTLGSNGALVGCGGPGPGSVTTDAATDAPMATPATCSTKVVHPDDGVLMEPGGDCISCHARNGVVSFAFAGTVMNALHDPTDCAGVAGVLVRVTGADGQTFEVTTNDSGNFYALESQITLAFPYQAEISRNGVTVPMLGARSATETDCASCHTPAGHNGAPGRILAP
jgi:hypothetical protein